MLKKQLIVLALALMGLVAYTSAKAEGEFLDDRFYVAPYGTYLNGGGDRNGFDGWGGGLAIGKIINEYFNVEVKGYWQEYKGKPIGNLAGLGIDPDLGRYNADLIGGTIDMQYFFLGDGDGDGFRDAFSPYIVAAVGGQNSSFSGPAGIVGGSVASFVFETGLGATYEVLDNFLLRADVRYRLDTAPSSARIDPFGNRPSVFNDLLVNVGFVIPFGDKPVKTVAAPPADDCSTRDSDHDGVNDCDDKCPGTPKGVKVDEFGCPIRIELRGVNFMWDSHELTPNAKAILDKVATDLSAYPVKKDIEVRGHASTEGQRAHNQALSQRRSQSVADYLKSRGVANRLIAKGFGVDYPLIYPDKTEEQRAKNRRVELVWIGE
jgi:OOP family OmpA-OmpF porin